MKAKYWLLLVFLLALILRLWPLQMYAGWDESIYLQHAEIIANEKSNYNEFAFRPPLLSVFLSGLLLIWNNIFFIRIVNVILSAIVVLPLFLIGKKLFDEKTGLVAGLIGAVHPIFVFAGNHISTDDLVAILLLFSLYLVLEKKWFLLSGIIAGLGVLTKFTALAAVMVLLVYLCFEYWKKDYLKPLLFAVGSFVVILPYLIWNKLAFGSFIHVFTSSQKLATYAFTNPFMTLIEGISLAVLLGLIIYFVREKMNTYAIMSIAWFLLITLYLLTVHLEPRFLLLAIAPLIPLAGNGFVKSSKKWKKGMLIAVLVILLMSGPAFTKFTEPLVNVYPSPTIETAQKIDEMPELPIYVTTKYPYFAYYTNNKVIPVNGETLINTMTRRMKENGYLVIYKNATIPGVEWADNNARLTRIDENSEIVLYKYLSTQ